MRNSIVVAIAVYFTITVLSFASCERGTSTSSGGAPPPANTTATRALSIEQAISEARAYTPPANVTNNKDFDPLVFEMLRKEFIRQLEEKDNLSKPIAQLSRAASQNQDETITESDRRSGDLRYISDNDRFASAAPLGDSGKVTDLTYDDTGRLNWTYVNVGDYDSSGEVGIPDITMIAQYYLANTSDGVGDDALENWIDGDKSGEVGISDITPIAQGYLNYVSEYRILTSSQPDSGFIAIGSPVLFGDTGVFPHTFSVLLPVGVLQYVAVAPVDDHGEQGEIGDSIEIQREWHIETIDSEGNVGAFTSLILDSSGNPHISYFDFTNEDLKYADNTGSWSLYTLDSQGDVGPWSSIAIDSNELFHISYVDFTNENLKYAYYNGSSWRLETIDSVGTINWYTSIALDTNNNPRISYYDTANGDLKFASFNGLEWSLETVDSSGNVGEFVSLAIDSTDKPHISYYDVTNSSLKYATNNGSIWDIATVDSTFDTGRYGTSVCLGLNDQPHISYYDGNINCLKYAHYDGTLWIIDIVDSSGDVGLWSSIALDTNNNPHISYYSIDLNFNLKYAFYNGASWVIEIVDSANDVGLYTSIALDSLDRPHISYYDFDNGDLKYAWFG